MAGFWFLEVSSLLFVYMLFNFFFSGHMFPLDMLPDSLRLLFQIIPLQYLAYFPAAVFLGSVGPTSRSGWRCSSPGWRSSLPRAASPSIEGCMLQRVRRMSNVSEHPSYSRVFLTFARNSLIRDMTFRGNFLIETVSSMSWVLMNIGFYMLIFQYTPLIGSENGWGSTSSSCSWRRRC